MTIFIDGSCACRSCIDRDAASVSLLLGDVGAPMPDPTSQ